MVSHSLLTIFQIHTNEPGSGSPSFSMAHHTYETIDVPTTVDLNPDIHAQADEYTHREPPDSTYDTAFPSEEVTFCVDLQPNQHAEMSQSSSVVPPVNVVPDDDFYSMAQAPKDLTKDSTD